MRNPAGTQADTTAPTAPTSLTTSGITSTTITLNWAASTDNVGVTGYKLFNGATQVGTTTTTSYQFTGLTANTAYTLGVQAYDAAGNNSTKPTANATTSAASDTTAPTAPSSLTTSGITSSTITLNWAASTDNVGVTGYKLYKGGVYVTTVTTLSYQFTGLTASTQYTLGVAATDAAGNNSSTASGTATTSAGSGGSNPCASFCSNPIVFTTTSYTSGNLGSGATCHEFVGTLNGGNFGNFVSPRTFSVNGVNMGSAGGNYTLPAKVNGGYCFQANAGANDWAYFGVW
jgi:chitodextrinase